MTSNKDDKAKSGLSSMAELLKGYEIETDKVRRISREFQDYAYRLALDLDDLKHKSLYMRLAKNENRALLEEARTFVKGSNAKNKGGLFMWKLKEMREKKKQQ